ncbi:MAG: hypothetical protein H6709_10315 [Kofleriaceae bacterium]|nr:hypothetical protein [Kofleriaceae bacterium]
MTRRASVFVVCALLGCGGGPRVAPGPVQRDLAAGGATSLPAAMVSYGAPLAIEAPISLTASDGTGLTLTRLDARAVVDGPLAFTELHLTFANPQDRVIEGHFAITLPDGAAVSRFAMQIDGRWQEAEMVEQMAARRAYEDFLHRKQDPALLEKAAGNEFAARVFPIPARGDKQLIVSYSQALPDPDAPFVLPLRGLPRIGEVSAKVAVARVDGAALRWDDTTLSQRDWQPDRDLAVPGSGAAHALAATVDGGTVVAVRVAPELAVAAEPMTRATILIDTSASRGAGFAGYARAAEQLVAALARAHDGLEVTVAAFDQGVEALYTGPAAGAAGAIEPALLGRMPLGASDLGGALAWAKAQGAAGRVVVITDGVVTAGEGDAAKLGAAVAALGKGVDRVDVVLAGGIRDRDRATALVRGHLGHDGAVLDLDAGADEVARRLGLATRSGIAVAVDGATWTWPTRLDGVQPGDAAMIYARLDARTAPAEVTVHLGTGARALAVEPAVAPLVERAAVGAEIARREAAVDDARDADARAAAIAAIVALSTRYRVLSSYTSLLVLETEDDYARFGIDRQALAGILAIGADGVEVVSRKDVVVMARPEPPATVDDEVVDKTKAKKDVDADQKEVEEKPDAAKPEIVTEAPPPPSMDGDAGDAGEAGGVEGGVVGGSYGAVAHGSGTGEGYGAGASHGAARGRAAVAPRVMVGNAGASATRDDRSRRRPAPEPEEADDEVDQDHDGVPDDEDADGGAGGPSPYEGRLATVMAAVAGGRAADALAEALAWRKDDPGDVLALIALGEAFEAGHQPALAGRAYGSIIDLFPARADLRRFAGERLDRLAVAGAADAGALAIDTYQRAVEQRPDHLTGHRVLAYALVRAGRLGDAFAAVERGLTQAYPDGRFREGERVLREDLGMIGAAWQRAEPRRKAEIARRLKAAHATLDRAPSLRFVLTWETDANDVDFHIRDRQHGHAYYEHPELASGGALYADITDGYGPECFTIPGPPKAAPYHLSIHYYSRGPMGYGMGKLEVVRHDGKGGLTFEERPFVVMVDQAFVDLGAVE